MRTAENDFPIFFISEGESSTSLVPMGERGLTPFSSGEKMVPANNGGTLSVDRYSMTVSGNEFDESHYGGATLHGILGASWQSAGIPRTQTQHGSNSSPNAGLLGIRFPYISIIRPRVEYPSLYNEHFGRPTNISEPLKNFSGYTVVAEIHLDGVSATMPEKKELENLLKGGVIL